MSPPETVPAGPARTGPGGVIHDLGYRRYTGPRLGTGPIARSLFVTGLLNAFGFGRSGRAKALPLTLLVIMVIPAAVMVAVMVTVNLSEGFLDYSAYPVSLLLLISIFVAAQAPVLFSRDLRSGAIALYLARPLGATTYALVRWASLFVAVFLFIAIPVLTLYAGALAAKADIGEQTPKLLAAMVGIVLLAALLATIAGLLSAFTTRRGLAIGITIVALLISTGIASAVKEVVRGQGSDTIGQLIGLISPFTLVDGIQGGALGGTATFTLPPDGSAMVGLYAAVAFGLIAVGLVLLVWRYRKQAGR